MPRGQCRRAPQDTESHEGEVLRAESDEEEGLKEINHIRYINDEGQGKEKKGRKCEKSVKDLKGYAIGATDGDIGKLDDFYFDDEAWTIRTGGRHGNWLLGQRYLSRLSAFGKAKLSEERLNVTLTKKHVEESTALIPRSRFLASTRRLTTTTTVSHTIEDNPVEAVYFLSSHRPIRNR